MRFEGGNRIYELFYADGETSDQVVGVKRHSDPDIIEYGYMFGSGHGLHVERVERETDTEIEFSIKNPQHVLFEGVLTLRITDAFWTTA